MDVIIPSDLPMLDCVCPVPMRRATPLIAGMIMAFNGFKAAIGEAFTNQGRFIYPLVKRTAEERKAMGEFYVTERDGRKLWMR